MSDEAILFVDDEERVLSSYQRVLRKQFDFEVASSGEQAIDKILSDGPYAVLVSDMRMPGMNGIELLRHVKSISPQTVGVMLTGNSDVQTAISAVNEGSVFRFLTKPCPSEGLAIAINDALAQYRLVRAEKELLEGTLHGSVRVLTEVLSLVNPAAFNQSFRLAKYVKSVVRFLKLSDAWQYEVAALLSNLGCVVLPSEIVDAAYGGKRLSPDDKLRFSKHSEIAQSLLCKIPRLEIVAAMIGHVSSGNQLAEGPVRMGANILRVCAEFDVLIRQDLTPQAAIQRLGESTPANDPALLSALSAVSAEFFRHQSIIVSTEILNDHMVFDEDLRTVTGTLLVTRATPITQSLLIRLQSYRNRNLLPSEIRVLIPLVFGTN